MKEKKLRIKGVGKNILENQLNKLVIGRLTKDLIPPQDVNGYLAGVQDVYRELVDTDEGMSFKLINKFMKKKK